MSRTGVESSSFFGARVISYDDAYDAHSPDGHALRSRLEAVLALAGEGPGAALDAGMGPGRLCAALAMAGWTVSGVDASAEMVDAARERMPEAASRLVVARLASLPFPDASFDLVTATGVLEYAGVAESLTELSRVARPGGRVVVSYPNAHSLYGIWKTRGYYRLLHGTRRLLRRSLPPQPATAGRLVPSERFQELFRADGVDVDAVVFTSYLVLPSPLDETFPRMAASLARRVEALRPRFARRVATQVVYGGTRR